MFKLALRNLCDIKRDKSCISAEGSASKLRIYDPKGALCVHRTGSCGRAGSCGAGAALEHRLRGSALDCVQIRQRRDYRSGAWRNGAAHDDGRTGDSRALYSECSPPSALEYWWALGFSSALIGAWRLVIRGADLLAMLGVMFAGGIPTTALYMVTRPAVGLNRLPHGLELHRSVCVRCRGFGQRLWPEPISSPSAAGGRRLLDRRYLRPGGIDGDLGVRPIGQCRTDYTREAAKALWLTASALLQGTRSDRQT